MSKRALCKRCKYPLVTCVCSAIEQLNNTSKIIILQDKNEVKNAKNTARLLALSLRNISIVQSDDAASMQALAHSLKQDPASYALFFPSASSLAFESHHQHALNRTSDTLSDTLSDTPSAEPVSQQLIFIDGTWRKAKRLYLSNPCLHALPSYHFAQGLSGQYRIRKTSIENGVSTLEAVSYVLSQVEALETAPLSALFEKMQSFWPSLKN